MREIKCDIREPGDRNRFSDSRPDLTRDTVRASKTAIDFLNLLFVFIVFINNSHAHCQSLVYLPFKKKNDRVTTLCSSLFAPGRIIMNHSPSPVTPTMHGHQLEGNLLVRGDLRHLTIPQWLRKKGRPVACHLPFPEVCLVWREACEGHQPTPRDGVAVPWIEPGSRSTLRYIYDMVVRL